MSHLKTFGRYHFQTATYDSVRDMFITVGILNCRDMVRGGWFIVLEHSNAEGLFVVWAKEKT